MTISDTPDLFTPTNVEIHEIPTEAIKFFVRRARPEAGYARLKQSIKEVGLRQPIQVRDIRKRPKSERTGPRGMIYSYELICGQGRLQAFRELKLPTIPAIIVDVPEGEIVGRFLAENVMRRKLSWIERARLIRGDVDAGMTPAQIAEKYFITIGHVQKCLKILNQTSPRIAKCKTFENLSIEEAEILTSLPATGQDIVVETLTEMGLDGSQMTAIVAKARETTEETGQLSKTALKQSLNRTVKDLAEIRPLLKLRRLHWSLGPQNLSTLLEDKRFRSAVIARGINLTHFEKVSQ